MQLTTLQGTTLTLSLTARKRVLGGHPQPIVEFRYLGGILCASYYLADLLSLQGGLCLEGDTINRQDLDAATLDACKQHCVKVLDC